MSGSWYWAEARPCDPGHITQLSFLVVLGTAMQPMPWLSILSSHIIKDLGWDARSRALAVPWGGTG